MTWTPQEIALKLRQIARLSSGELQGWHDYCTTQRTPFPGEIAALQSRSRALGMTWPPSLPAETSGTTTAAGTG